MLGRGLQGLRGLFRGLGVLWFRVSGGLGVLWSGASGLGFRGGVPCSSIIVSC